jgi:arabinofuranan 3-O-arabinosyltransferase
LLLYADIARNGLVGWPKLVSVYAAARQAEISAGPAFVLHGGVALLACWAVWQVWRSDAEPHAKASVLIAATMLASPYLFFYDTVVLTVPLLFLAERRAPIPIVSMLWLAPIASIAMIPGPINVGPLLPIALLILLWRRFRDDRLRDPVPGEGRPMRDRKPAFG